MKDASFEGATLLLMSRMSHKMPFPVFPLPGANAQPALSSQAIAIPGCAGEITGWLRLTTRRARLTAD